MRTYVYSMELNYVFTHYHLLIAMNIAVTKNHWRTAYGKNFGLLLQKTVNSALVNDSKKVPVCQVTRIRHENENACRQQDLCVVDQLSDMYSVRI